MKSDRNLDRACRVGAIFLFLAVLRCLWGVPSWAIGPMDASKLPGSQAPEDSFLQHYAPVKIDFTVKMPSYDLPLKKDLITNLARIESLYLKDPKDRAYLQKNGFVVVEGGAVDSVIQPYETLTKLDVPIWVTPDTLLHLYHIQFDETLKEIEEREFYPDAILLTKAMLERSDAEYKAYQGELKEAARRNVAYFSVALRQFTPKAKTPSYVRDWVDWECERIEKHEGLSTYGESREKSLFRYPEDYSQYKPRGHYTRSEDLKKYFRGMMWFGRQTFLLKGHEKYGQFIPPMEALVDRQTARIQTLQSLLISGVSGDVKVDDHRTVAEVWDRIYAVTAFYVGLADDLTLYEYRQVLREVFGAQVKQEDLLNDSKRAQLLLFLTRMRAPAIFSGTGGAGIDVDALPSRKLVSVKQLDDILNATQGFRLMGQRYIPDSYVLGQLVSPGAGFVNGRIPERFTVGYIDDPQSEQGVSSIRAFPRGLDVFSVLGSERAADIIEEETDHEYPKYEDQIAKLRQEFGKLDERQWNRNLYWSWLYCLKALVEPRGQGYQTFQRQEPWTDRQLSSVLASWASLRHDTILYAKQSYTPQFRTTSARPMPPPPPPPKGLVEPCPEFIARILAMTRMTREGLDELDVLRGPAGNRLQNLESLMERLYEIMKRQVRNQPITEHDNRFLASFASELKGTIGEVDDKGLKTSLIADVHTDLNTKKCLEEGSGYVDYLIVAYKRPAGDIILAVGPVFSYYEFKHPMKDRLTDEQWREMLSSGKNPERPTWQSSFTGLRK